jgi:hypothetical protein
VPVNKFGIPPTERNHWLNIGASHGDDASLILVRFGELLDRRLQKLILNQDPQTQKQELRRAIELVDERRKAKTQGAAATAVTAPAAVAARSLEPPQAPQAAGRTTVDAMMQQIQTLQPQELVDLAKKILQATDAQGGRRRGSNGLADLPPAGANGPVEVSAKLGYGRLEEKTEASLPAAPSAGHPSPAASSGGFLWLTFDEIRSDQSRCSFPHCPLLTAHCPLPSAQCSLLTAHCPLPSARCSLLASGEIRSDQSRWDSSGFNAG